MTPDSSVGERENIDAIKTSKGGDLTVKTMTRETDETIGMSPGYEMNSSVSSTEIEEAQPVSFI